MQEQLNLFQTVNESPSPLLRVGAVMRSVFVETHKWQEFHENGQLWIDGEIAIVSEMSKHLHRCFDGWYDTRGCDDLRNGTYFIPKGTPVCRIGVWTKYFDNGQLAWQLDYGDGTYDYKSDKKFPSYRKDGTLIVRS